MATISRTPTVAEFANAFMGELRQAVQCADADHDGMLTQAEVDQFVRSGNPLASYADNMALTPGNQPTSIAEVLSVSEEALYISIGQDTSGADLRLSPSEVRRVPSLVTEYNRMTGRPAQPQFDPAWIAQFEDRLASGTQIEHLKPAQLPPSMQRQVRAILREQESIDAIARTRINGVTGYAVTSSYMPGDSRTDFYSADGTWLARQ